MDERFNTLSQQLFNKSLADCSTNEIKQFIDQYPYFAPAQFLLLKKLQKGTEEYQTQYQKAILYFHEPLHFDALIANDQLNGDFFYTEPETSLEGTTEFTSPEIFNEEIETAPPILEASPPEEENIPEPVLEATPIDEPVQKEPVIESVQEEPVTEVKKAEPASELSFEPFHTVDYFASQGIKLSVEELPKDQLGKQLKSFTEWLKTMKRLPAAELNKSIDTSAERKVENLAEHSLLNADIVTEAMAEVWYRQGNTQKALEVYNKLSLQNPSKRAYFAAKIDNLKKSN